jgi:SAM-dependent methyltransferase
MTGPRAGTHRSRPNPHSTKPAQSLTSPAVGEAEQTYLQADQPEGVPPLELTGERTLPDVVEENYWYRRHVAVYEWIAERCAGLRVVDLACGEGYGSDLLAGRASQVIGVDANPEAYEHARARYPRPNLTFERGLVEDFGARVREGATRFTQVDAVVFLQTIEHIHEPEKLVETISRIAPAAYISTPNRLTLAPPGAEKSDNPWHLREYDAGQYRELLEPHFASVELLGLFHARKLRAHELAIKAGWDRIHPALHITKPFYDRFIPAITASDFRLRSGDLDKALDFLAVCRA